MTNVQFPISSPMFGIQSVITNCSDSFKELANKVKAFVSEHRAKLFFAACLAIGLPLCILGGHVGIAVGVFIIGLGAFTYMARNEDNIVI
jgi:hypothetical protein